MAHTLFRVHLLAFLGVALLAGSRTLPAQTGSAPFVVEESGQAYARLQDAVDAIGPGQGTIRLGAGYHRQCAVQREGRIAFVAHEAGRSVLDGVTCEGKAALVLRGEGASVDGLVFQNMRVPDGNGAGIRLENGDLRVTNSLFRSSEEGILTADDPSATLTIDRSTFSNLGRCDRGLSCAHGVYTGYLGRLSVTRTRFEKGAGGHYLKTRAMRVDISDNSFDDSQGRQTNYMIDLPSGSVGRIEGNMFVQGRDKENHSALIAVAAEERHNRSAGLKIDANCVRLPPELQGKTVFVADWSGEALAIGVNDLEPGVRRFERR